MRRRRPALLAAAPAAALIALTLLIAPAGPVAAAPDDTAQVAVPDSVSAVPETTGRLQVAVPDGLVPRRLNATLTVQNPSDARVILTVAGREVHNAPARSSEQVTLPLRASDVTADGVVEVTISELLDSGTEDGCRYVTPTSATLEQITLDATGTESAPDSVGTFFPAYSPAIDVAVSADAGDDVLNAALNAVTALADRYDANTDVRLTTAPATAARAGVRQVSFEQGPNPVSTAIEQRDGVPNLVITGSDDALTDAARALGSPALALADDATTSGLSSTKQTDRTGLVASLGEIAGRDSITLTGYGTSTAYVSVRQDAFGGPIDALDVMLKGTHTAVPDGAELQLDLLFNGALVASTQLADGTSFALEATVDAGQLSADNGLELRMTGMPAADQCVGNGRHLPLELHLDTDASELRGSRGAGSVAGFARFPQVLAGQVPLALRADGAERVAQATDAATLLTSLQRSAARQLTVQLTDADDLVAGDRSGVLVGATHADSTALKAPLRLDRMRLMDYVESELQVGTDQPFAALQAVNVDRRDVLLLGGWSPTDAAAVKPLITNAAATVGDRAWTTLADDVLVATTSTAPFTLDSNAIVPQDEVADERRSNAWWFVGGVAVLLVLLGVNYLVSRNRKRRVRRLVDAQERADRTE